MRCLAGVLTIVAAGFGTVSSGIATLTFALIIIVLSERLAGLREHAKRPPPLRTRPDVLRGEHK